MAQDPRIEQLQRELLRELKSVQKLTIRTPRTQLNTIKRLRAEIQDIGPAAALYWNWGGLDRM